MATLTANIAAQATEQAKEAEQRPRHHNGPRQVEQKALSDKEPDSGVRKRLGLSTAPMMSCRPASPGILMGAGGLNVRHIA